MLSYWPGSWLGPASYLLFDNAVAFAQFASRYHSLAIARRRGRPDSSSERDAPISEFVLSRHLTTGLGKRTWQVAL